MSHEVIYAYSRRQAIEDGVLVDVSTAAREAGFRYPVALTRAVWERYVTVPPRVECQDEAGRLWDVLWMLRVAIRVQRDASDRLEFVVHVRNDHRRPKPVRLVAVVGPGDDAEPVFTIMLPNED